MQDELGIQFEIFPSDALERYHLEGKLRVVGEDVLLHYKNRERTFTREQNKLITIEFDIGDIDAADLHSREPCEIEVHALECDELLKCRAPRGGQRDHESQSCGDSAWRRTGRSAVLE